MLSPLAGGYLIAAGWSQAELFAAAVVPALICIGTTFLLALAEYRRRLG